MARPVVDVCKVGLPHCCTTGKFTKVALLTESPGSEPMDASALHGTVHQGNECSSIDLWMNGPNGQLLVCGSRLAGNDVLANCRELVGRMNYFLLAMQIRRESSGSGSSADPARS